MAFASSGVLTGSQDKYTVTFWDRKKKDLLWTMDKVMTVIPIFSMDVVMLLYQDPFSGKFCIMERSISKDTILWDDLHNVGGSSSGRYGEIGYYITLDSPQNSNILTHYIYDFDPHKGVCTIGTINTGMMALGGVMGGALGAAALGAAGGLKFMKVPKVIPLKNYDTFYMLTDKLYEYNTIHGLQDTYKFKKNNWNFFHQIIRAGKRLYLTEDKLLTCLDVNMEKKWSVPIPKLANHYMEVFADTLCLVNNGYCYEENSYGYTYRKNTDPYIAYFDRKTGKQLSVININRKKYKGDITQISINDDFYYRDEMPAGFSKHAASKDSIMILFEDGGIAVTDNTQQNSVIYHNNRCYLKHFEVNDTVCIIRKEETDKTYGIDFYLINKQGKIIYRFPDGTKNVCYVNKEFYYCTENHLFCLKF